jgi:hypothetical protein
MNRQGWWAIAAALVLAVLIGGLAYNFGVHQGLAQSGKIVAGPAGPYPYPYYGWHPWGLGFFPIFPIFFFVFLFLIFRGMFWRGRWHRYGYGCGPAPQERENDSDRG